MPYSQLSSDFRFYDNHVHHVGNGIGSNGGKGGRIENNTVEYASGHGVFCGAQAGDIVFNGNTISNSNLYGLLVACSGPNLTVTNNTIADNCQTSPGGGSGLHVDATARSRAGSGLIVRGNTVDEPHCRHAVYLTRRDDVQISGNLFRKGSSLGTLYLSDARNITVSDTRIEGEGRVPAGIFLRSNVNGLSVRSDVSMTGYTQAPIIVSDPASVTNVVVE